MLYTHYLLLILGFSISILASWHGFHSILIDCRLFLGDSNLVIFHWVEVLDSFFLVCYLFSGVLRFPFHVVRRMFVQAWTVTVKQSRTDRKCDCIKTNRNFVWWFMSKRWIGDLKCIRQRVTYTILHKTFLIDRLNRKINGFLFLSAFAKWKRLTISPVWEISWSRRNDSIICCMEILCSSLRGDSSAFSHLPKLINPNELLKWIDKTNMLNQLES